MTVRDSVLKTLTENKGSYISGEELSKALKVSRTTVWNAIKVLREAGYPIESSTNKGYMMPPDKWEITEESLRLSLPPKYRNNQIHIYDTLDSTNIRAKQLALENAPHGTIVMAKQQTAGRGRLGRSFFSPREGIYLSIIVRPDFDLTRSVLVTSAAAVAVTESIENVCGIDAGIKWVNDVYADGKKVCGILTEGITDFETGQIESLVIGIGVNTSVKDFPNELLEIVGAVEGDYPKPVLAASIISRTLDLMKNIESRDFITSYKEKSLVIGRNVKVFKGVYKSRPEEELESRPAKVLDIDDNGCLVVLYTDGTRESLSSGEISVRL